MIEYFKEQLIDNSLDSEVKYITIEYINGNPLELFTDLKKCKFSEINFGKLEYAQHQLKYPTFKVK